jgi:branched-chain amino acid transport system ATP-binding protein
VEERLLLSIKNIRVHYGALEAVRDVSMEIPETSITSLLGANGSGKSTILKAISGLKDLISGEIWFDGQRIDVVRAHKIAKLGIAHIPEGKQLFPYMSVIDNLSVGAYSRDNKKEIERDIEDVFEQFSILKGKRNKHARLLSGGEQETLAIARGLMLKPKLLLMDEPLQGLAPLVQQDIAGIILDLNKRGLTVLMVEHNVHMALEVSHDVYVLDLGKIVLHGAPQELTKTEYVQKIYLAG